MEIEGDRRRYSTVKLLSSIFCLLLSSSISQTKAQEALSLEQAIRHAQDSTIMAFQSRQEYNYYTLHYGEFMALRKPQLNLRVAPNYSRLISDLSRDYVYLRNYDNLSAAASITLSQKMLDWGGEAYIGSQAVWSEYFSSQSTEARQFMAAPILVGYRQTLLGYNPYRWEKAVEDQRLKAARQQHQYNMNSIAEEVTRRFFRQVCTQGQADMYRRNLQTADTLYAILYATAVPGETLFRIVDTEHLKVCFDILENELQRFEKGTVITMAPISYPDDRHYASITAISPVVEKNGVVHLEATLTPHPHLIPGMSAIIALGKIDN